MTDNELRAHDIAITLLPSQYRAVSKEIENPDYIQVYKSLYDVLLKSINREFGEE